MPTAEIILWSKLKGRGLKKLKFRRQYGVGRYVIDFYCPELKLAIEVDGDSHFSDKAKEYDLKRQKYIENFGIKFIRFTNEDIYQNLEGVLEEVVFTANKMKNPNSSNTTSSSPPN